jgi:hypothetical protein
VTIDAGIPTHRPGVKTVPLGANHAEGRLCAEGCLAGLGPMGELGGRNRAKQSQFPGRKTEVKCFVVNGLWRNRWQRWPYKTNPILSVEIASSAFGLLAMTDAREDYAVWPVPGRVTRPNCAKQSQCAER